MADATEARAEPTPQSPAPTAEAAAAALVRAVNAVAFATAAAQEEPAGNAALSQAELAGLHCQHQTPHPLLCCQTWTEASECCAAPAGKHSYLYAPRMPINIELKS